MQLHASAAGGLPQGPAGLPAGLPPGLLAGPGAAGAPAGLPTSIPALLAGIPSSLAQAGPHPAFASLLAQQKPSLDIPRPKDEELKRAIADTNGSKYHFLSSYVSNSTSTFYLPFFSTINYSCSKRKRSFSDTYRIISHVYKTSLKSFGASLCYIFCCFFKQNLTDL